MKDRPTCETCDFYHDDGHCRRFPPTQPGDRWPSMDGNRWCGEHKPVETLAPAHKIDEALENYRIGPGVGYGLESILGRAVLADLTEYLKNCLEKP